MEFVTSWYGTLVVCIAAWMGTLFFFVWLYEKQPETISGGEIFIAASVNSIFALLFIHLVLKQEVCRRYRKRRQTLCLKPTTIEVSGSIRLPPKP